MPRKKVKYIFSQHLLNQSDKNPAVTNRANMVHELIRSYRLLDSMEIVTPRICNYADLRSFHSTDYLNYVKKASSKESDESDDEEADEDFGLGFDCPTWNGIFDYMCAIGGATMTACDTLCKSLLLSGDIVINWFGGWHHAHRDKAGGYCYVNDIVMGILVLRKQFNRILYIDLDVHHGDGVQEAFETTKRVFTLSFHQFECGFYPGTGSADDCGFGNGKGYAANFPYASGISGHVFGKYFKRITKHILDLYRPEVCIIQCGADAVVGDPLGATNLTPEDLIECIQFVLERNLPTIILGGGGYHFPNTSRYWTQLTAALCGKSLTDDIPDENEFFLDFGPDYCLRMKTKVIPDINTEEYLEKSVLSIEANLKKYAVTHP